MARYTVEALGDAFITEGSSGFDLSADGGANGVGRATLSFSGAFDAASYVAETRYGDDIDGETGSILLSVDYDVSNTFRPVNVRVSTPLVLAPITSQAPIDQPIPILIDLQLDKDVASLLNASLLTTYTASYRPEEGQNGFDQLFTTGSASIAQVGDASQFPVSVAELFVELETNIDDLVNPNPNPSPLDPPFPYGASFSVVATAPVLRIHPNFMVVVDGVSVPADEVYVLAAPENLGFYGDFPEAIPDALDGFEFDPGNALDLRDRTVRVRGVDEDGLEAGWSIGEIRNVTFEVPEGASVIQTRSRPSNGADVRIPSTFFEGGQPLIAVVGDGVTVRNAGAIEGRQPFGAGVLLVVDEGGDANAVENTGDIRTTGFRAPGVLIGGPGARVENDGLIETTGRESYGVWALGEAIDLRNDSDIRTTGDHGIGLKIGTVGDAPSVFSILAPSLGEIETLVADELDADERPQFFAPTTGTVVNAGLIETTAATRPASAPDRGAFQPALLAVMNNQTVLNEGVLRADDLAVVLLGDNLTLRNTGTIEATANEDDDALGAVFADGLGRTTIDNSGRIAGDVVYAAPYGALTNTGVIDGALGVAIGNLLNAAEAGTFELEVGDSARLGDDEGLRHILSLVGESGIPGTVDMTIDGEIRGGITALALDQTIMIGAEGSISSSGGAALTTVGDVVIRLDGMIEAQDDGVFVSLGEPFNTVSTLDLVIGGDASIIVQDGGAVSAFIDGSVDVENAGVIRATGPNVFGVRAADIVGQSGAVANSGTIEAAGNRATALGAYTGQTTNSGLITATGAGAVAVDQALGGLINGSGGVIRASGEGAAAVRANGATGQLIAANDDVVGVLDVANAGSIVATGGAAALRGDIGDDRVANAGAIRGDILLGPGSDTLIWREGASLSDGVAVGGTGTDTLVAEGGALDGSLFQQFERFEVGGVVALGGLLDVGAVTVGDGGTLSLDGVINGDVFVADGGALQGVGVIVGHLSASDLATIAPGFSPGVLRVEGDVAISGRLVLEVGPDGSDGIEATGALDLTGATIEIVVAEGFDPADAPLLLSGASVTGFDEAVVAFSGPGAGDLALSLTPDGVTVASAPDNRPPVAQDDGGAGFATAADAAFDTADVLANDFDLDLGDTVAFFDFDASGARGRVSYNGDGTFRYDPNDAFDDLALGETAFDSFTYRVTDGTDFAAATVTVAVTGVADPVTVIEGAPDQRRIEGTDGPDRILIGSSRSSQVFGGDGADVFVFGRTAADGRRDVAYLRDFEQGLDRIDLSGHDYALRTLGGSSVVTLMTSDRDTLFVTGVTLSEADLADASANLDPGLL
ncbi:Ig-like domain-containing protein [Rubrimonas sp.]|uniref:Ig-like domain-containing protein n=1 Tax=Rubrimonas sp. TaxID=2036015 RepID=UPI002FDEBB3B